MHPARWLFISGVWLLLAGCGALWIFVGGSIEETECESHHPGPKPTNKALKYACEMDGGTAYWDLLGSDCTDVPQPPPHGTWRCTLDAGASWWEQE